jgi:hypothetical protein
MSASTKAAIREFLFNHYEFGECILQDVKWIAEGTCLEFVFNYIWSDDKGFYLDTAGKPAIKQCETRPDLNMPLLKVLRFNLVQELHVRNHLNRMQQAELGKIGWRISEVARVSIEDDNLFLAAYRDQAVQFHHVSCRWEDDRRIDIVFSELQSD